jgi:hypothetical protein
MLSSEQVRHNLRGFSIDFLSDNLFIVSYQLSTIMGCKKNGTLVGQLNNFKIPKLLQAGHFISDSYSGNISIIEK